jgi:hypothetical protein
MLRVPPWKVTDARIGKLGQPVLAEPEKLPAPFAVKERVTPALSVT